MHAENGAPNSCVYGKYSDTFGVTLKRNFFS